MRIELDESVSIEVSTGHIILRQKHCMCGLDSMTCLILNKNEWDRLMSMKHIIVQDIETINNKTQHLNMNYTVGRNCFIKLHNTTKLIMLQFWFRFEHSGFRPDIISIRLSFGQWKLLMESDINVTSDE